MIFYFVASFYKAKKPLNPVVDIPPSQRHEGPLPKHTLSNNQAKGGSLHMFRAATATRPQEQSTLSQRVATPTDGVGSTLTHSLPALPGQLLPFILWEKIKSSSGFQVTFLLLMISGVVYLNLQDLFEWQTMTPSPHATHKERATTAGQPVASPSTRPISTGGTNSSNRRSMQQTVAFFYANNMKNYYCLNYRPDHCTPDQLLRAPIPETLENIYEGAFYYAQQCTACHGHDGQGNGPEAIRLTLPMKSLSWVGSDILDRDAYLFWIVAKGGSDFGGHMPPFKAILDENKIWQIVFYLKTIR